MGSIPIWKRLLDIALILHAEHGGGNNSTFTTHLVSSTGTDTYSAISAAIGSLKGPKHGGANLAVIHMMRDLKENVSDITDLNEVEKYLHKVIRGEANDGTGLIYGLGHAVYTVSDPRAQLLKKMARTLAEKTDSWMNLCSMILSRPKDPKYSPKPPAWILFCRPTWISTRFRLQRVEYSA